MPVCYAPPVETGPYHKGGEFSEPPNLTTPRRFDAWSPYGGVELEGAKKSTILTSRQFILFIFLERLCPIKSCPFRNK